jgi:type VII secretion-associated protein (TIGR03931 family)
VSLKVAVDFGTSSTCAAMSRDGREPQVVATDGMPVVSSAVYGAGDGTLFVGQEAERQAAIDPSRFEPHPKRRIDEGELLLGNTVVTVLDVVRAVLRRAVDEARRLAGGVGVDLLVLTHPADWGAVRSRVLRQAGRDLARELRLVPEPVAAAVFHAAGHQLREGAVLAVLDLGGGTVDASAVRLVGEGPGSYPQHGGFRVLATRGEPHFGGADIDQSLLCWIGESAAGSAPEEWLRIVQGRELADRRRRRMLRADVRSAKETLSRHTYTDVPLPPPFRDVHLTRNDLERLVAEPLGRAAGLVAACLWDAGVPAGDLAAVFLVGGSSRIPLIARLVQQRTGILPTTLDAPETVVARGALRMAEPRPLPPAGAPAPRSPSARPPWPSQQTGSAPGSASTARPLGPSVAGHGSPASPPRPAVPSPLPPRRKGPARLRWLLAGAGVLLLAAAGAGVWLAVAPSPGAKRIAQYDYSFALPRGWRQSGGDGAVRKVQIVPKGSRSVANSIVVQEFPLSSGDRGRNVRALRAALGDHGGFTGVRPAASYAGKRVVSYHQPVRGGMIDWYVLFRGRVQVTVGCEYTDVGKARVAPACRAVVASMSVTR